MAPCVINACVIVSDIISKALKMCGRFPASVTTGAGMQYLWKDTCPTGLASRNCRYFMQSCALVRSDMETTWVSTGERVQERTSASKDALMMVSVSCLSLAEMAVAPAGTASTVGRESLSG